MAEISTSFSNIRILWTYREGNARFWRDPWKKQRFALLETRKPEGNRFWNDKKAIKSHFIRNLNEWRGSADPPRTGYRVKWQWLLKWSA